MTTKDCSSNHSLSVNENQRLHSDLYPHLYEGYLLLELCCFLGPVDCFKFLRTKFNSKITDTCPKLSFLGGNQEIMNECLKCQQPNNNSMFYVVISHNIDFVTFLMNQYKLEIDLYSGSRFSNFESF